MRPRLLLHSIIVAECETNASSQGPLRYCFVGFSGACDQQLDRSSCRNYVQTRHDRAMSFTVSKQHTGCCRCLPDSELSIDLSRAMDHITLAAPPSRLSYIRYCNLQKGSLQSQRLVIEAGETLVDMPAIVILLRQNPLSPSRIYAPMWVLRVCMTLVLARMSALPLGQSCYG